MKHYIIATEQPWGVIAYGLMLMRPEAELERWRNVLLPSDLKRAARGCRYVFFLNWSAIVPPDILRMTECVNFHCTKLPYGRGGAPIENLILRGRTETVITAHRMTTEIDAGPIYGTRGPVSLSGTKPEILERFIEPCVDLIRWIVDTEPEPYPQVSEVVRFERLSKAEMEALWRGRA